MAAARTIGTVIVIALFFGYIYAANIYVQMSYGNRFGRAGPAVPQETIREVARTITDYMQVVAIILVAMIVVNIAVKSRRILGIIPLKDLQRHMLLLGPTGAGKTTIAKDIIRRALEKKIKVTILDWKAGAGGLINPAEVGHYISSIGRLFPGRCQSLHTRPERGIRGPR